MVKAGVSISPVLGLVPGCDGQTDRITTAEKSVGGDVKKSITLSFFNRITFYVAVRRRTFQEINM